MRKYFRLCSHRNLNQSPKDFFTVCKRKLSIKDLNNKAKELGGKCLSNSYSKINALYKWQCGNCNHVWFSNGGNVYYKSKWCIKCASRARGKARRKYSINSINELLKRRKIVCKSTVYKSLQEKMDWSCLVCGHNWCSSTGHVVQDGTGCPVCAGKARWNIRRAQEYAEQIGWKLKSTKVVDCTTKLNWECELGHKIHRSIVEAKKSHCPKCNGFWGEEYCREVFQNLFLEKFPKIRPGWLKNINGALMELDGYSEKLKLAFEHQGMQHYKRGFQQSKQKFNEQLKRDKLKRKLCKLNGITLIVIKDIFASKAVDGIERHIYKLCLKKGYKPVRRHEEVKIKFQNLKNTSNNEIYKRIKSIASASGAKLVTKTYIPCYQKYVLKCKKGHFFKNLGYQMIDRVCCPYCAGNARITQQHVNKRIRGLGVCLTKDPNSSLSILRFQCIKHKHFFKEKYESVVNRVRLRSYFCPICKNMGFTDNWYDKLWEKNYKKIVNFYRKFNHVKVPIDYDKSLYFWVKRIRALLKKESTYSRMLIGDRSLRLERVGLKR